MAIAGDEGRDTIRKTESDVKRTEELGNIIKRSRNSKKKVDAAQVSPSTIYTEALIRWENYNEIREDKKDELKDQIEEIRSECKKYDIPFSEVLE